MIGAGGLGFHHARILREMQGPAFAGFFDANATRAAKVAGELGITAFPTLEALLDVVDAVTIVVPTPAHFEVAREVLARGIHALIEKPIATTLEEADAMLALARTNGALVQTGHVERFNPVVTAAIEVATEPQFFEIHRLAAFTPRSLDIDVVLDLMIHDLDIVLHLVRSPIAEVRAVGIPILSRRADIANVRVEFENGCVANLTASRVSYEKTRKLRFFQPHDYISVDYATQTGIMVSLRMGRVVERKLEPAGGEPLKLELESFAGCVQGRSGPVVSGEDGFRALELAIRINEEIARRSK